MLAIATNTVNGMQTNSGPVPPQECWRMVWTDAQQTTGDEVTCLLDSTGTTTTQDHLYCATTRQECADYAATLGMYVPDDAE
jgi:hypothetical protein